MDIPSLSYAWPDALTGFHAIEAKLFGADSTDILVEADRLIYHLSDLDIKIHRTPLNAQGLLKRDRPARL